MDGTSKQVRKSEVSCVASESQKQTLAISCFVSTLR